MTDQTPRTEAGHIPQPSDICTVCGNGLVHIDSSRAHARNEALDVKVLARAINKLALYVDICAIPTGDAAERLAAEYQRILAAKETPYTRADEHDD